MCLDVSISAAIEIMKLFRTQVMDTPGLLARSREEFNAMEKMTLASIAYLPSIVIFVFDLSGTKPGRT